MLFQNCEYSKLGQLAAMALVHGGASFRLFGASVYNFLSGVPAANLIAGISEVPDMSVRVLLNKASMYVPYSIFLVGSLQILQLPRERIV